MVGQFHLRTGCKLTHLHAECPLLGRMDCSLVRNLLSLELEGMHLDGNMALQLASCLRGMCSLVCEEPVVDFQKLA